MLGIVCQIGLLWLTVLTVLYWQDQEIYDFHAQLRGTGSHSDVMSILVMLKCEMIQMRRV